jgi:hypothetical protein
MYHKPTTTIIIITENESSIHRKGPQLIKF